LKTLIIGLDCVPPEFVFQRFPMPALKGLMRRGSYGALRSVVPPITVPAWACMMTGVDPGGLGIYGFRNRKDFTYDGLTMVTSASVPQPAIWDQLGEIDRDSIVIGVPPSYPPRPIRGHMVSCFMTPSANSMYTFPSSLKAELEGRFGPYLFDVTEFRTEDKSALLQRVHAVTKQKFAIARYLMTTKPWDLCAFVDMGPDRLHHGFWKYWDPEHIRYRPGNPFGRVFEEYYAALDEEIAGVLALVAEETAVLVVSDHGAKRMDGGICVNEWLRREGYLVLKDVPSQARSLAPSLIDWSKTTAWGEGGYYSRISLNVRGREPHGIVERGAYEHVRDELIAGLEALGDEQGRPLGTRVYRPEALYQTSKNIPPDLLALFGDLHWRSVGSVGLGSVWTRSNDLGPDDANHAQYGMFIAVGFPLPPGEVSGLQILDIAPLLRRVLDVPQTA
jgi:predicted AlkP superfamily phosphohydrolase/phosphomutase